MFLRTCSFNRLIETPYRTARSASSMTLWPLNSKIACSMRSIGTRLCSDIGISGPGGANLCWAQCRVRHCYFYYAYSSESSPRGLLGVEKRRGLRVMRRNAGDLSAAQTGPKDEPPMRCGRKHGEDLLLRSTLQRQSRFVKPDKGRPETRSCGVRARTGHESEDGVEHDLKLRVALLFKP